MPWLGGVAPASPFDTTTACYPVVTSAMADYAGTCVPGAAGTPGESLCCNLRPIDVLVADTGCVDGTSGGRPEDGLHDHVRRRPRYSVAQTRR